MNALIQRRRRLCRQLRRLDLAACFATGRSDVRYLSGFTGEDSALVVTRDGGTTLVTDRRFEEQSAGECGGGVRIVFREKGLAGEVAAALPRAGAVGFDPRVTTVSVRDAIASCRRRRLCACDDLVRALRQVKDAGEIAAVERASRVAIRAFRRTTRALESGWTETAFAATLDHEMRLGGAQDRAFETIALADARGSLPHGRPSRRRIARNGTVLVDWGACVGGYRSDLTRIVATGTVTPIVKRLCRLVLDAQARAIERIRPGVSARTVDAVARQAIERAGFGDRFGHGLGHGVGLDVHELPVVSRTSQTRLREGMVFSVEPGIYLPGEAGVRVEDLVVVTRDGCRRLTAGLSRRPIPVAFG